MASVDVIEKAFLSDGQDTPIILTGDLNATPQSAPLKLLEQKGWVIEDKGKELPTVPTSSPRKQIDYILVRPGHKWRIFDVSVIEEELASDHRPIMMTLELISGE
jgi:endonuclease/exonuclease/phosphatase family metal-dependent hydrolase